MSGPVKVPPPNTFATWESVKGKCVCEKCFQIPSYNVFLINYSLYVFFLLKKKRRKKNKRGENLGFFACLEGGAIFQDVWKICGFLVFGVFSISKPFWSLPSLQRCVDDSLFVNLQTKTWSSF